VVQGGDGDGRADREPEHRPGCPEGEGEEWQRGAFAESLAAHKKVERVWYPGLADHPQRDLCTRQMRTAGGMLSFEVKGGLEPGKRFMRAVKIWSIAESLGAVESLINHPVTMTHGAIPKAEREASGLTDGLIRLSVGIESGTTWRFLSGSVKNSLKAPGCLTMPSTARCGQ